MRRPSSGSRQGPRSGVSGVSKTRRRRVSSVINREVGLNCRTPGSRPFSAAMTILIAEQRAHFVLWVQWRFGPRAVQRSVLEGVSPNCHTRG